MKHGTAARLVCWPIVIVILVVLFLPGITMGISYIQGEDVISIGYPCEYDLEDMDEESLENNLSMAFDGKSGYVEYGETRVSVNSSTDFGELSSQIMSSTAKTARALDSTGVLLKQRAMLTISDGGTRMSIAVETNKFFTSAVKMDPILGMGDENNMIPFYSEVETDDATMILSFEIPWLMMEVANTLDYDLIIDVDVNYANCLGIDVDVSTIMDKNNQTVSMDGNALKISNCSFMRSNLNGSIGECTYTVEGKTLSISAPSGKISEYLLNSTSDLTLKTGESTYKLTTEQVRSLGEAFKQLEALA